MIKILPELKECMFAMNEQEKKQLEESILSEGCRDALIIWNGVLIDGHNRYEICTKHGITFRTVNMDFKDIEEAKRWIIFNQLARRNLTDEQRKYYRGKGYLQQKRQGERTDLTSCQNGTKLNTAETLANEHGVSEHTIKRDGDYAKAVDEIANNLGNNIKNKILTGGIKLTDKDTKKLAREEPEIQKKIVPLFETGQTKKVEEAKMILSPAEQQYQDRLKEIDREHENHKLVSDLINNMKFIKIDEKAVEDYMKIAIDIFQEEFTQNCDRLINKLNEMKIYYSNITKIRRVK